MSKKIEPIAPIAFTQLEEALEERQKPDRRQAVSAVPKGLTEDRRKQDRRAKKTTT